MCRILVVVSAVVLLVSGVALAEEKGERTRKKPGLVSQEDHWLRSVPGMTEEFKKHRENMKAIIEELTEAVKAKRGGEDVDGEAKLKEIAGKLVDERIRHEEAKVALIKASRETAVAAQLKQIRQKMKQRFRTLKGGKGRRQNKQEDDGDSPADDAALGDESSDLSDALDEALQ